MKKLLLAVRLAALSLLLLPLAALAGPGTSDPSGVRGSLYVSPSYPFSLVWDTGIWSVDASISDGATDRLELISPWSRLAVVAYPAAESRPLDCATEAVNILLATAGTHQVVADPNTGNGYADASVRTLNGRVEGDVTHDITCIAIANDASYMILVTHSVWTNRLDIARPAGRAVMGSIRASYAATAYRVGATPTAAPVGWLEVDLQEIPDPEWAAPLNPSYQLFTMQIIADNVDTTASFFDARNVQLVGLDGVITPLASSIVWMTATGGTTDARVAIAPGETVIGRMVFVLKTGSDPATACYALRGECLDLGSFGSGGSGIRPRINPG